MAGIVGYTQFKILGRNQVKSTIPIEMIKSIMFGHHQEIRYFSESYVKLAIVTIAGTNGYSYAVNEDGTLKALIYGYVYDLEKHKKALRNRGHTFLSKEAAEFVCHAYEEYGEGAFAMLNGSFSIVMLETKKPQIILVTDRFGTRPIYYSLKDGELIFSSHARAIPRYPGYQGKLNERTLVRFLMYGKIGILGDDTWFEGVKLMPSASILKFSNGENLCLVKYWDLKYQQQLREKEAVQGLMRSFIRAVNIRAGSVNGKLGIMLSGGLDSRSVLSALNSTNLRKVSAITFGTKNCDDAIIAKIVALRSGVQHFLIEYNPDDIMHFARLCVLLSNGEDTVNAAYIPYFAMRAKELGIDYYLQGYMFDLLLGGSFLEKDYFRCKNLLEFARALDKRVSLFSSKDLKHLLCKRLYPEIYEVKREFIRQVAASKGDVFPNQADYFFINTRVRRYTLMGSVIHREFMEELLPTIDNQVIEIIRRIPPELRTQHKIYRKFLIALNVDMAKIPYQKNLVPPLIPPLLWHSFSLLFGILLKALNKLSYSGKIIRTYFDFNDMLRSSEAWKKLVRETLLSEGAFIYRRGYLNRNYVTRLVEEHMMGKNHGEKIAFLITLELVLQLFFGE